MATTVWETGADFLNTNLGIGLTNTSLIIGAILIILLVIQVKSKKYIPVRYWSAVLFISIVGTLITDNMVDNFWISLELSSIIFSVALITTFILRYRSEKTLSIHNIDTTKRELFYWFVILFAFALWTAVWDLLAEWLQLWYGLSTLLFAGAIGVVTIAYRYFKLHTVRAFWIAYILTRPLGASLWDYLSQATVDGWLGLWTVTTSIIFIVTIGILVFMLTKKEKTEALTK